MKLDKFLGNWQSIQKVERLSDYGLDFSKWIGQEARDGYFLFSVFFDEEKTLAQVDIPIGITSYFSIYQGKFEHTKTQLKIWQNEQNPIRINYSFQDDLLVLKLFSKTIYFKKQL